VRRLGGAAGTHETKKKVFFSFHVLCMYLSSKHAEVHSNTFFLPFYGRKMPVLDTSLKKIPETACHRCSDMLFGTLNLILARTLQYLNNKVLYSRICDSVSWFLPAIGDRIKI
jgi:hypothetical protein